MRLFMPFVVTVVLIGAVAAPPAACASITAPDWNEPIVLKLKDGRQLSGRYHGDVGFPENVDYAERYEAWLDTFGPQAAPALGESLVVARPGAPPIRGPFRGFAEGGLLLGTADSCLDLVVPLGNHVEVRRAAEEAPDSDWLAARKLWNSAPSAYAIVLQTTDGTPDSDRQAVDGARGRRGCGRRPRHGRVHRGAHRGRPGGRRLGERVLARDDLT